MTFLFGLSLPQRVLSIVIAILTTVIVGIVIAILDSSVILVSVFAGVFLVGMLVALLLPRYGLSGMFAICGVVAVSGFLGAFDVAIMNSVIRWVCPLALAIVGLWKLSQTSHPWQGLVSSWHNLSLPLTLFCIYALSSVIYSSNLWITLGRSGTFIAITLGLGAALGPSLRSLKDAERLLMAVALSMALVIVPGEFYLLMPGSTGWLGERFRSTFRNPVTLGHISSLLLPLFWWTASLSRISIQWRIGSALVCVLLIVNSIASQSRTAVLAATMVVVLMVLVHFRKRLITIPLLIFGGLTIVALTIIYSSASKEYLYQFFTRGREIGDPMIGSGRLDFWVYAIQSWRAAPWFGHGFGIMGSDVFVTGTGYGLELGGRLFNIYLETLATGGVVGLVLLLLVLFQAFWCLILSIQDGDEQTRRLLIMCLATFSAGLVLNLTESWLVSAGSSFALYWWLVLMIGMRIGMLERVGVQHESQLSVQHESQQRSKNL